jgi:chemotaxis signal transduction protein
MTPDEILLLEQHGAPFAVPLAAVARILDAAMPTLTPSPEGLIATLEVDGQLVPLVFAATLFGHDEARLETTHRVVMLRHESQLVGLWVDQVGEVIDFAAWTGPLPESSRSSWVRSYARAPRLTPVVDIESVAGAPHDRRSAG